MSSEIATAAADNDGAVVAIRVSGLSKCYQIYDRPEHRLKQALWPRLQRLVRQAGKQYYREFWALQEMSFEVAKGQTLGVIGRNGCGKSTLLQLICGTLTPTAGSVDINGRVAALLELGSGFNPEFTGRENIYMSGAVLGLSYKDVAARFDDIVAFADIGDFIEQPVKTYSSGMYVRLAFAVIVHADADILVIDEALSVGDAVFTQKCMRFLRRFKETGTVLFVSHDAAAIVNLCSQAIWLDAGKVRMHGSALEVDKAYSMHCAQLVAGESETLAPLKDADASRAVTAPAPVVDNDVRVDFFDNIVHSDGWSTGAAEILKTEMRGADGRSCNVFSGGERVVLSIRAVAKTRLRSPIIGFLLKDRLGQSLFGQHTFENGIAVPAAEVNDVLEAKFQFLLPMLPNGEYSMTVSIADGDLVEHQQHHWLHDAILITVTSSRLRHGLIGIPFESTTLRVLPSHPTQNESDPA